MLTIIKNLLFFALYSYTTAKTNSYQPTWPSIDSRPLPGWYDDGKFGIFHVWGPYAVPGLVSEWYWYWWVNNNTAIVNYERDFHKPRFTYGDYAAMLTAEMFDAEVLADMVAKSGAKYYVLTSKHCDGFALWPSNYSWNWNSMDVGPKRDIVQELAMAFKAKAPGVKFGLYYVLFEWYHRLYLLDKSNGFKTKNYVDEVLWPQFRELVTAYKPEVIWSDGVWDPPDSYWNGSLNFLTWLYNESPVKDTVVTNDRWGNFAMCHHGGYFTCTDKFNPKKLQSHKWENAMTVDRYSWGFRRNIRAADILSVEEIITTFVQTISCGGNMLMNIGPNMDGHIIPIFEQRLLEMGKWLNINGEAVYASKPWIYQNDTRNPDVWYTSKMKPGYRLPRSHLYNIQISSQTIVYGHLLKWPTDGVTAVFGSLTGTSKTTVNLLGYTGKLKWTNITDNNLRSTPNGIAVDLSSIRLNQLPTPWAWVFRFMNLASSPVKPEIENTREAYIRLGVSRRTSEGLAKEKLNDQT